MTEAQSEDKHRHTLHFRTKSKSSLDSKADRLRSKKSTKQLRPPAKERRSTTGKAPKDRDKRPKPEPVTMMKTETPASPTTMIQTLAVRALNVAPGPISPLGAGRLDPFGVYPTQQQYGGAPLPMYVHEMIDHCINHIALAFVPSDDRDDLENIKRHTLNNLWSDELSFYTILLAGVTHLSFVKGETEISREKQLLRLSYKTEAMTCIRADIKANNGKVSDRALLAMNTLATHGALDDLNGFTHDKIQDRKGFGRANDSNYYSLMRPGIEHYSSLVKFVEDRGGIESTLSSPGLATGIAFMDILTCWRDVRPPRFPSVVDTEEAIKGSKHKPDALAITYARRLLSGFSSLMDDRWLYSRLMSRLKHMRCVIVDFEQWQRQSPNLPDIRRIFWIRHFVLHDLLSLPIVGQRLGGNRTELGYELVRISCLAFMQLVIYPMAAINEMPQKILKSMLPVIDRWTKPSEGKILSQDQPGSFIWALVLAGMLAFEHYETTNDSALMDSTAKYFDRVSIKAEKRSWPMVKGIMGTHLWLESECDGPGQRAWNYACLWLAERDENEH